MKKELIEGFNKMPKQKQMVFVFAEYLHKEILRAQIYVGFKCGFYGDNEELRKDFEAENESVEKLAGIIGRVGELAGLMQTKSAKKNVLKIICDDIESIEDRYRALLFFERVCYSKGLFECAQIVRVLQLFFETIKEKFVCGESSEEESAVCKLLEANVTDKHRASIWFSMYKEGFLILDDKEKRLRVNLDVLKMICKYDNAKPFRRRSKGAGAVLVYGLALCMFDCLVLDSHQPARYYFEMGEGKCDISSIIDEINMIFVDAIGRGVRTKRNQDRKTLEFPDNIRTLCDHFKIGFPSNVKQ